MKPGEDESVGKREGLQPVVQKLDLEQPQNPEDGTQEALSDPEGETQEAPLDPGQETREMPSDRKEETRKAPSNPDEETQEARRIPRRRHIIQQGLHSRVDGVGRAGRTRASKAHHKRQSSAK